MNLPVPTCADCGIARFSTKPKKSPYCKRCIGRHTGRDPARRAKASASMKARLADPVLRAIHTQRTKEGTRAALRDPEFMARRRELGRRLGKAKLGHLAHPAGSESRAAAGRASSNTKLAWCPVEYRDDYKELVKHQHIPASEARQMIEAQIAADARRYSATGVLPQSTRAEGVSG